MVEAILTDKTNVKTEMEIGEVEMETTDVPVENVSFNSPFHQNQKNLPTPNEEKLLCPSPTDGPHRPRSRTSSSERNGKPIEWTKESVCTMLKTGQYQERRQVFEVEPDRKAPIWEYYDYLIAYGGEAIRNFPVCRNCNGVLTNSAGNGHLNRHVRQCYSLVEETTTSNVGRPKSSPPPLLCSEGGSEGMVRRRKHPTVPSVVKGEEISMDISLRDIDDFRQRVVRFTTAAFTDPRHAGGASGSDAKQSTALISLLDTCATLAKRNGDSFRPSQHLSGDTLASRLIPEAFTSSRYQLVSDISSDCLFFAVSCDWWSGGGSSAPSLVQPVTIKSEADTPVEGGTTEATVAAYLSITIRFITPDFKLKFALWDFLSFSINEFTPDGVRSRLSQSLAPLRKIPNFILHDNRPLLASALLGAGPETSPQLMHPLPSLSHAFYAVFADVSHSTRSPLALMVHKFRQLVQPGSLSSADMSRGRHLLSLLRGGEGLFEFVEGLLQRWFAPTSFVLSSEDMQILHHSLPLLRWLRMVIRDLWRKDIPTLHRSLSWYLAARMLFTPTTTSSPPLSKTEMALNRLKSVVTVSLIRRVELLLTPIHFIAGILDPRLHAPLQSFVAGHPNLRDLYHEATERIEWFLEGMQQKGRCRVSASEHLRDILGDFLCSAGSPRQMTSSGSDSAAASELQLYLADATLRLTTGGPPIFESSKNPFDILLYWKSHSKYFPHLSQLARAVLAIPATTDAFHPGQMDLSHPLTPFGVVANPMPDLLPHLRSSRGGGSVPLRDFLVARSAVWGVTDTLAELDLNAAAAGRKFEAENSSHVE